ncbi:MAG: DUF6157 family protein [Bacteroidia bacterium]|nr:DUF6157 family protein [Bacteroidia bacterium]
MKQHSTNYFDTFIEVAEDTKVTQGTKPPSKGDNKTVAEMQYDMIAGNPYKYSSDDVFFRVFADRNNIPEDEYKPAREQFFSKGQPCFRASPLTKTYGFGIHSNSEGKIALCGMESDDYRKFVDDANIKKVKAMKSKK